jgi:hypothetical protein
MFIYKVILNKNENLGERKNYLGNFMSGRADGRALPEMHDRALARTKISILST